MAEDELAKRFQYRGGSLTRKVDHLWSFAKIRNFSTLSKPVLSSPWTGCKNFMSGRPFSRISTEQNITCCAVSHRNDLIIFCMLSTVSNY